MGGGDSMGCGDPTVVGGPMGGGARFHMFQRSCGRRRKPWSRKGPTFVSGQGTGFANNAPSQRPFGARHVIDHRQRRFTYGAGGTTGRPNPDLERPCRGEIPNGPRSSVRTGVRCMNSLGKWAL